MTVSSTTPVARYPYTGPGDYSFSYKAGDEEHITVDFIGTDGVLDTLTRGTDFTVTLNTGEGGTVTMINPTASGGTIDIRRELEYEQPDVWTNQGAIDLSLLEAAFDRVIMLLQQLNSHFGVSSSAAGFKGDWATTTLYEIDSVVVGPDSNIYSCMVEHTSGTFSADLANGKWAMIIDVAQVAADKAAAEAAKLAAESAQSAAEDAETIATEMAATATTMAASASDCADDAAASASTASSAASSATSAQSAAESAQAAAEDARDEAESLVTTLPSTAAGSLSLLQGSSITSNYIAPTGAKTFTTQTGKNFMAGMQVMITRPSDPTNYWMEGEIISYNSSTGAISIQISACLGSGTYTSWYIFAKSLADPVFFGKLQLTSYPVPASATATGVKGTIVVDADHIYLCTATNVWKRVAVSTW